MTTDDIRWTVAAQSGHAQCLRRFLANGFAEARIIAEVGDLYHRALRKAGSHDGTLPLTAQEAKVFRPGSVAVELRTLGALYRCVVSGSTVHVTAAVPPAAEDG